jgi:hypothetical protein
VRGQFTVCVAFQSSLTLPLSLSKGEATERRDAQLLNITCLRIAPAF